MVSDKEILRGVYDGETPFYNRQIMGAWMRPTLWWTSFIIAASTIMICLNVIVRKQWTEHEKLAYPIIQLPYGMTSSGFFRNRTMWVAFGIAASLDIVNGLNFLWPTIPGLFSKSYQFEFAAKPWNSMGRVALGIYPFVLGIGFLIPLGLLFSLWFFFWIWKAQLLLGGIMGWPTSSGLGGKTYPYVNYQGFGGYMGIFLIALWISRQHLSDVGHQVTLACGRALGPHDEL